MQDLFQNYHDDRAKEEKRYLPLSVRRRPTSLSSYYGQKHLLGEGKLLARSLEKKQFSSSLFFGPPGVGKTTLAEIIAKELGYELFVLNGIKVSLNDLQQLLEKISYLHKEGGKALLFLDEIHRFNKSQQDALLPFVKMLF